CDVRVLRRAVGQPQTKDIRIDRQISMWVLQGSARWDRVVKVASSCLPNGYSERLGHLLRGDETWKGPTLTLTPSITAFACALASPNASKTIRPTTSERLSQPKVVRICSDGRAIRELDPVAGSAHLDVGHVEHATRLAPLVEEPIADPDI